MRNHIQELSRLIHSSKHIVAFTGAGISTESGIPDFRSPDGIWSKVKPIMFDDFLRSKAARKDAWNRKIRLHEELKRAKPNRGHRVLASLIKDGLMSVVITQNIDGLHQMSGIPEDRVIELHGNATYAVCLDCGRRFSLEAILKKFEKVQVPPACSHCGGLVKSGTISFGQQMPLMAMNRAHAESASCDLFLTLGSSLVVYPAAGFPLIAKENGAKLVIINNQQTDHDQSADLVINEEIGRVLGEALDVL